VSKVDKPKSKLKGTADAVPWALLLRGGLIVGKRWTALSGKERARFVALVRDSRGRLSNLSVKQRLELRKLARKLDLKSLSRELLLLRGGSRRGRKRH
jgi:hypothetical protein